MTTQALTPMVAQTACASPSQLAQMRHRLERLHNMRFERLQCLCRHAEREYADLEDVHECRERRSLGEGGKDTHEARLISQPDALIQ